MFLDIFIKKVSIHAPARGATNIIRARFGVESFNPRARAGRDKGQIMKRLSELFQSTRPRGARQRLGYRFIWRLVSIHAPARGATVHRWLSGYYESFNPRARAGRDEIDQSTSATLTFQSTRPRGARLADFFDGLFTVVSIHAPARGATIAQLSGRARRSFNPRARAGRDRLYRATRSWMTFQSTRPRGARLNFLQKISGSSVSIHAPARGATRCYSVYHKLVGFNPRARAGRDRAHYYNTAWVLFQSTRPRGARHVM